MNVSYELPNGNVTKKIDSTGDVILSEVFSGVGIKTEEGNVFGVCQRDSGLEITTPTGGHVVGVKIDSHGNTFVEVNGRVVYGGSR